MKTMSVPTRFLLSFLVVLLYACQAASPAVYSETFDADGQWSTSSDAVADVGISNGELLIRVFEPGQIAWSVHDVSYENVQVSVDAHVSNGPLDNEYGILMRMQDESAFIAFSLSADGFARAARFQNNSWQVISEDWTPNAAIHQGLVENHLEVVAEGGHYIFRVNDQTLFEIDDDSYNQGTLGLYAGAFAEGGVEVAFDNLEVIPIE